MIKKLKYLALVLIASFLFSGTALAAPFSPSSGGTGTSTPPTYGKLLVGNAQGTYSLMATTSLGISTSQWTTTGANIYYSTGAVGVGTSTPGNMFSESFTVSGTAYFDNVLFADSIDIRRYGGFNPTQKFSEGTTLRGQVFYDITNNRLTFQNNETNAADAVYIADPITTTGTISALGTGVSYFTGNLGVGTTSPYAALSVVGASGIVAGKITATSTAYSHFTGGIIAGSQTLEPYLISAIGSNASAGIGDLGVLGIVNTDSTALNTIGFQFGQANTSGTVQTVGSWDLIGDSHVVGAQSGSMAFATRNAGSFAERLRLRYDGNIGVGTTTPNWLLTVSGTRPSIALSDFSAGANSKHWLFSSMGGNLYIGPATDIYGTTTPAALTILNNGNIGIGSSTPAKKLSVVGETMSSATTTTYGLNVLGAGTATSTQYIYSSAAGKGGQIILEDEGGGACTAITTKAGTVKAAVVTCPTEI